MQKLQPYVETLVRDQPQVLVGPFESCEAARAYKERRLEEEIHRAVLGHPTSYPHIVFRVIYRCKEETA